jgi:hypothetical protein
MTYEDCLIAGGICLAFILMVMVFYLIVWGIP